MSAHVPVMLREVLANLAPADGGVYLDATFGGGGYACAILERARCTLWAIDRDPDAIARGAALVARFPGRLHLLHGRFGDMLSLLAGAGMSRLDGVVLDLGVSSFQLDDAARGFSFRSSGPLDMRMGRAGPTAAELVNALPETELADILYEFGEERLSRRIAKAIVLIALAIGLIFAGRKGLLTQWADYAQDQLNLDADNNLIERIVFGLLAYIGSFAHITALAVGAIAYAILEGTEGVGLAMRRRWAEYLTVIATGILIPFEAYEVIYRATLFKVGALLLNVAVVGYLAYRKRLFVGI